MAGNNALHRAIRAKNDEFYTQLSDIENELKHYKEYFRGKVIFCNCDDPYESNFFKHFAMSFNEYGLKKLIATCYATSPVANTQVALSGWEEAQYGIAKEGKKAYKIEISEVEDLNGDGAIDLADVENLIKSRKNTLVKLQGDGDFRSDECIELLKEADIVVTNPPFSLFREYVAQLVEHEKKFIIIGNKNAITYKDFFPLLKNDEVWIGYNAVKAFIKPNGTIQKFGNVGWYTNFDIVKRHEEILLWKSYTPEEYPKYDNYDAIDVAKISDIPCDYYGVMGVPITFLDKYNPTQFEILDITDRDSIYKIKSYTKEDAENYSDLNRRGALLINGRYKSTYAKILIRRRK